MYFNSTIDIGYVFLLNNNIVLSNQKNITIQKMDL